MRLPSPCLVLLCQRLLARDSVAGLYLVGLRRWTLSLALGLLWIQYWAEFEFRKILLLGP
jgi:hypothetical protein